MKIKSCLAFGLCFPPPLCRSRRSITPSAACCSTQAFAAHHGFVHPEISSETPHAGACKRTHWNQLNKQTNKKQLSNRGQDQIQLELLKHFYRAQLYIWRLGLIWIFSFLFFWRMTEQETALWLQFVPYLSSARGVWMAEENNSSSVCTMHCHFRKFGFLVINCHICKANTN